jgi:hypothetical protein
VPGRGPLPKPAAQRQRTNRASTGATLESGPAVKVPLEGDHWHKYTLRWWDVIWSSPMAAEWVDADLPSLFRLARLDDEFWRSTVVADTVRLASEIRQQQAQFGLTPMSRRSLQWEVKRVESSAPPTPQPRTASQRKTTLGILEGGRRTG